MVSARYSQSIPISQKPLGFQARFIRVPHSQVTPLSYVLDTVLCKKKNLYIFWSHLRLQLNGLRWTIYQIKFWYQILRCTSYIRNFFLLSSSCLLSICIYFNAIKDCIVHECLGNQQEHMLLYFFFQEKYLFSSFNSGSGSILVH